MLIYKRKGFYMSAARDRKLREIILAEMQAHCFTSQKGNRHGPG
jgi:hypothetical protein